MPDQMNPCPVCQTTQSQFEHSREGWWGECSRCGRFAIAVEAITSIRDEERYKVSGWIHDQNRLRSEPKITMEILAGIRAMPDVPFVDKPRRLLAEIISSQIGFGDRVDIGQHRMHAAIYSINDRELSTVLDFLFEAGWLEKSVGGKTRVTAKGYMKAEEEAATCLKSAQAFVALWFTDEMRLVYEGGFEPAIRNAGYEPFRIDRHEHVNRIDDEIIAQIRRSRFVVADFTGHRGGVYFEAGYALGRGLPVVWTCRQSDLEKLHFDTRQYNFIDWENTGELATRLQVRIEATIGDGPFKSPS